MRKYARRVGNKLLLLFCLASLVAVCGYIWWISRPDEIPPKRLIHKHFDNAPTIEIAALALSPDGRKLLTGFRVVRGDGTGDRVRILSLWDSETGRELWTVCDPLAKRGRQVHGIVWLPDGQHALVSGPEQIAVWDVEKGRPLSSFGEASAEESVFAISADGRRAVSYNQTNRVWDVEKGRTICWLHGSLRRNAALSPDGKQAIGTTFREDGKQEFTLWDVDANVPLRSWGATLHCGEAHFSPDGKRATASVSADKRDEEGVLITWDLRKGRDLWRIPDWIPRGFSSDGNQIFALLYKDRAVYFGQLDSSTGAILLKAELQSFSRWETTQLRFSADGSRAAGTEGQKQLSGPGRILIEVWDTRNGKSIRSWEVSGNVPDETLRLQLPSSPLPSN